MARTRTSTRTASPRVPGRPAAASGRSPETASRCAPPGGGGWGKDTRRLNHRRAASPIPYRGVRHARPDRPRDRGDPGSPRRGSRRSPARSPFRWPSGAGNGERQLGFAGSGGVRIHGQAAPHPTSMLFTGAGVMVVGFVLSTIWGFADLARLWRGCPLRGCVCLVVRAPAAGHRAPAGSEGRALAGTLRGVRTPATGRAGSHQACLPTSLGTRLASPNRSRPLAMFIPWLVHRHSGGAGVPAGSGLRGRHRRTTPPEQPPSPARRRPSTPTPADPTADPT